MAQENTEPSVLAHEIQEKLAFDPALKKRKAKKRPKKAARPETTGAAASALTGMFGGDDNDERLDEQTQGTTAMPAALTSTFGGNDNDEKLGEQTQGTTAMPAALTSMFGGDEKMEEVCPNFQFENALPVEFYGYNELLKRAFVTLHRDQPAKPELKQTKKFSPTAPKMIRIGSRKSCIVNFGEVVKSLNRQSSHVQSFIVSELGSNGSLDDSDCLIMKGRFQPAQIESVLRRYIKEYVFCHTCLSPETQLVKEDRLTFLKCERCLSRSSVASIKAGFKAQIGKRAAQKSNASVKY